MREHHWFLQMHLPNRVHRKRQTVHRYVLMLLIRLWYFLYPVHSFMLSVRVALGLPLPLLPATLLCLLFCLRFVFYFQSDI